MKSRGGRGGSSETTERTMMMPAPAFARGGRAWRPFAWRALERVSKHHIHLLRNLEWMLPNVRRTGEVSDSVRIRLKEMLEDEVSLSAEYVHVVPPAKLRRYVGEPTFLAVLAPQPNKTRGLLEVELGLAHIAIDMLLGGTGEAVALRPLTDIEEGVISYVLIETLKALAPTVDPSLPRLRLEGIVRSFEEALAIVGEDEDLAVVQLKAAFGSHSGYVRLFIPETVLGSASPPLGAPIRRARRASEAERHRQRLGNVKVSVRAEIGQVEITAEELGQLREGDVVLVGALSSRPDKGELGTAKLRVGLGRTGYLDAEVSLDGQTLHAKVTGFAFGEPATPAPPVGEGAPPGLAPTPQPQPPAANGPESPPPGTRGRNPVENAEGVEMLNDIPLQIAVELGRLAVSAEDVVGLKVGHVFDLNRVPSEPVDLSVNGRIVARGELVEIDGNLGVRILSLAG